MGIDSFFRRSLRKVSDEGKTLGFADQVIVPPAPQIGLGVCRTQGEFANQYWHYGFVEGPLNELT